MPKDKDLYEVVVDALKLHASYELPQLNLGNPARRLVVASGNALPTGKIIFQNEDAVIRDEGQYKKALAQIPSIDGAVVISASGEKDAPTITRYLLDKRLDTYLLTCNGNSSAAKLLSELLSEDRVFETRSNKEPVTYNTSTYMGMILAKTREDPKMILQHITQYVVTRIPDNLGDYKAFTFIVPPEFDFVREMFYTKDDELFYPKIVIRSYTSEQMRHAKNVIASDDEMFVALGFQNRLFGAKHARLDVPLFDGVGYAAVMAIGYYIIGKIQERNQPYFHNNSAAFEAFQRDKLFDQEFFDANFQRYSIKPNPFSSLTK